MNIKAAQVQPLFDNILIKPLDGETKTSGGILLPETSKEKPQMGKVMAVGTGSSDDCSCDNKYGCGTKSKTPKMILKKGDTVLYKKWGGTEVKVEGKEWMLIEQKDILAIIK